MFKKIIHYFTSKSLESHRVKTQCMIEEYEQASARSQARIKAQVESCTARLQTLRAQREASVQEFAQFLSEHLEQTGELVPLLLQLQDALFTCLGHWTSMKLAEERVQLQREKIKLVVISRELLNEAEAKLLRLSQQGGRQAWQALLAQRPPRVCTPDMNRYMERFGQEVESDAKAYAHELRRISSQLKLLRKQRDELRTGLEQIQTAELQPARDAYQQSRTNVHELYYRCRDRWTELQVVFENYFQNESSDSDLANQWLDGLEEGGTFDELRRVIRDTKFDWEAAKARPRDLQARKAGVQEQIDRAHNLKNFSMLERDKRERSELNVAIKQAFEYQNRFYDARQIFVSRCDEIRSFLGWIRPFHPSNVVEQFHQRMEQDGGDLYRQAIGLKAYSPRPPARISA